MKRFRFRIGVRLALLFMALACVLSAYLRASLDLRRETIRSEILKLESRKFVLEREVKYDGRMKCQAAAEIPLMNAEIAEMQRKIGIEVGPNR